MEKFFSDSLIKLEETINEFDFESDYSIQRLEVIIDKIVKDLASLKAFVSNKGFISMEQEIRFFKYQKPLIVAKLIYYNTIYKIEARKPYGTESIKKYLNKELKKQKRFFNDNLDFYKYYRSNNSFLDHKYFVRGNLDIQLCIDTGYFQSDVTFSTSHDYKVAKIIANDLIQVYIEDELYKNTEHEKLVSGFPRLNWTGSKASLIELIYALHYQRVFDNGNKDIREIARYIESSFNIDLGNFYQTYLELRNRKMNRTKFLDTLREELIKKMDEQDER